jgi:RNA polymerase sigma-70 factor (ECF subfamily)
MTKDPRLDDLDPSEPPTGRLGTRPESPAPSGTPAKVRAGPAWSRSGAGSEAVDDSILVRRVLAGRVEDFAALVERYQRLLYGFVERELGDAHEADEVVQETFLRAYQHLGHFRFQASFKTWLFEIALNECRNRRRRTRPEAIEEISEAALACSGMEPTEARLRAELERAVARLPPRQRRVVRLRTFADLPFREIARLEGISVNAAKVNYHRAVRRLKEWLG